MSEAIRSNLLLVISWCALTIGVSLACSMVRGTASRILLIVGAVALWFMVVASSSTQSFVTQATSIEAIAGSLATGLIAWIAGTQWLPHLTATSTPRYPWKNAHRERTPGRSESGRSDLPDWTIDSERTHGSTHFAPSNNGYDAHAQRLIPALADAVDQFDDWRHRQDDNPDPWPQFAEFVRGIIHQTCGAGHIKILRLIPELEALEPMESTGAVETRRRQSSRNGIVGHVLTTGRSYVAGDSLQGELLTDLAKQLHEPCVWCFAITNGPEKLGVISVGELSGAPLRDRASLRCVEKQIGQMWRTLAEVERSTAAITREPISGLYNRDHFLRTADLRLKESYEEGEPVALAVIAVEGLRNMDDHGDWEGSVRCIKQVAACLKSKVRGDDVLGRFDDSRFVLLLRRVDSALAELIVKQLAQRLGTLKYRPTADSDAVDHDPSNSILVRCGLAGSGTAHPSLRSLLSRAINQCHQARKDQVAVASDLQTSRPTVGAAAQPVSSIPEIVEVSAGI